MDRTTAEGAPADAPIRDTGAGEPDAHRAAEAFKADLVRRIEAGDFDADRKLPSEQRLALEYGLSRGRVRTVLAGLARRGLIATRPRFGWSVQARSLSQPMDRMQSLAQWARHSGRAAGGLVRARQWGAADAREARHLGIRLGDAVLRTVRVRTLDGQPVMIERSTWEQRVAELIMEMPDDVASMTDVLDRHGFAIVRGDHRIEAASASKEDAELLGVRRSSSMLQVARVSSTRDGTAIEVGVDRYVAGVIAFEVRSGDLAESTVPPTAGQ